LKKCVKEVWMERKLLYCAEVSVGVTVIDLREHCAVDQNFAEGT
jgi:hypothetical protein